MRFLKTNWDVHVLFTLHGGHLFVKDVSKAPCKIDKLPLSPPWILLRHWQKPPPRPFSAGVFTRYYEAGNRYLQHRNSKHRTM